ncbi:PAS domain-containing protein [Alteromonas facilis]|uniref:PAS domain-containing protein n=1 Tax=Alteromonas facilis TaxID=2048004 RepID=UPI000F5D1346|nr:PAS domain-containing protein [Alteromonas facilis]
MIDYKQLLASVNTLICAVSPEGKFLYLNEYWREVLGWTLDTLYEQPFVEFLHPSDVKKTMHAFELLVSGKEAVTGFRNRYHCADNSYVWLEWAARIDKNGNVVASALPVDEKVALESHDKQATVMLQQAEKLANVGHWHVDRITREVFWSDQIYAIHGVDKESFTPTIESSVELYHPDDRPVFQAAIDKAINEKSGWSLNLRIVRPSGEERHVRSEAYVQCDDDHDEPIEIFGVSVDITDIIELNQKLRLLSKVAEVPTTSIVITNPKREIEWVNDSFMAMSKYSLDELRGKNIADLLAGEETDKSLLLLAQDRLSEGESIDIEVLYYTKKSQAYWVHTIISPLKEGDEITHFIEFHQDITKRKMQDAQLMSTQKIALAGQISAGICDDINNVLAIIGNSTDVLASVPHEESINAQLRRIKHGVERGRSVTSRLLNLTRGDSRPRYILDLDEFIAEAITVYQAKVPTSIEINTNLDANRQCLLDPEMLEDTIHLLVDRAKRVIPTNGNIVISTHVESEFLPHWGHIQASPTEASDYIVLSVSDTGQSIPMQELPEVFLPYFESANRTNTQTVDLSSVATFAINHGCGLVIESFKGKGTSVSLWLPVCEGKEPMTKEIKNSKGLQGLNIVIVDDETDILEVTKLLLTSDGASVMAFEKAEEALQYVTQNQSSVDIVISDQTMKGQMQGNELISRITESCPQIYCVIMTGYSAHKKLADVNVKVLQKPLHHQELVKELLDFYD